MPYLLYQRRSPEQIALVLAPTHPKGHAHCMSHDDTICNCIDAQTLGELRKKRIA